MMRLLGQYALAGAIAILAACFKVVSTSLHAHLPIDWDEVAATGLDALTPIMILALSAMHLKDIGSAAGGPSLLSRLRLRHPPPTPPGD